MKLTIAERKLLIKILENTVERFEPEDLIHMINGPKYRMILDGIYDECFRPHTKYGVGLLDSEKELTEQESTLIWAMWEKVRTYISEQEE